MYINASAIAKTAVLWLALGAFGYYHAGQKHQKQEAYKAAVRLQPKTDYEKCQARTDDATGLICAKYHSNHQKQKEAFRLANPPQKE